MLSEQQKMSHLSSLEGAVIQRVMLVDRITRSEATRFRANSLPGHLLHMVVEGEVRQRTAGRQQRLRTGSMVWYFENESIQGEIVQVPWTFYTVNFEAPTLAPPPENKRMQQVSLATASKFERLFEVWRDERESQVTRQLGVHAVLLDLLLDVLPSRYGPQRADRPTRSWWAIETALRSKLDQVIDLAFLQDLSGLSQRSIVETCQLATGTTPMKRVKELRLSYARGLVQHSDLTISEIAYRIGYSRVQELSRDYHERFGVVPRQDRLQGTDYRTLEKEQQNKGS